MADLRSDLRHSVQRLLAAPPDHSTDAELLQRFAATRDEAAFALLVQRHGPLVYAVCRRVLLNDADADDATQSTFLVLATKCHAIRQSPSLAAWLHGVALRVAQRLRAKQLRQRARDAIAAPREALSADTLSWADGQRILHEELGSLPDHDRQPLVLCYLLGHTQDVAARQLGLSKGTLKRRLEQARERLRHRLIRRGLGPAGMLLGAAWPDVLVGKLPATTFTATMRQLTHPTPTLTALTQEILFAMKLTQLKSVATLVLLGGLILFGGGLVMQYVNATDTNDGPPPKTPPPKEAPPRDTPTAEQEWSATVQGLQARISLVEKPKFNGTRMLVPYLELRNVSDSAYALKVRCGGSQHVKFELVGVDGQVLDLRGVSVRDGPHPDPGTVSLPIDSSLRISMHCTNWGVPKDAAAMISTDSGSWVLNEEHQGKVFLRATIKGEKLVADDRTWAGTLETPKIPITWGRRTSVVSLEDAKKWLNLPEQLRAGTAKEKSLALDLIREWKPLRLIPDLIAAIEDPTTLPRDGDAGWGFVGHQAATILAEIARDWDGISVGMGRGDRPYAAYSFHTDQSEGGKKLQQTGRLAEVRKNWAAWWDKQKK